MILIDKSWMELKPNEDIHQKQESFEDYYSRIKLKREFSHIPKEVFEQWIHPHHKNDYTIKNYAWINYHNIEFNLCEWNFEKLTKVHIIEDYKDSFNDWSRYIDFEKFCCCDKDLEYWKENGTWRTPPIIIDIKSVCSKIPDWSELRTNYQLVEGHSRLTYLHSVKRISELSKSKFASKHKIYLMIKKHTND